MAAILHSDEDEVDYEDDSKAPSPDKGVGLLASAQPFPFRRCECATPEQESPYASQQGPLMAAVHVCFWLIRTHAGRGAARDIPPPKRRGSLPYAEGRIPPRCGPGAPGLAAPSHQRALRSRPPGPHTSPMLV